MIDMDEVSPGGIGSIFEEAVKLPEAQRKLYLDRVCAGQAELRRVVESLLKADAEGTGLLARSAMDLLAEDAGLEIPLSAVPLEEVNAKQRSPQRCAKGHFFDHTKYGSCPLCGTSSAGPVSLDRISPAPGFVRKLYLPEDSPVPAVPGAESSKLIVGWLVCVEGPDYGRDFRLLGGKNLIGRDASMNICLAKDSAVAEKLHAVLTHDSGTGIFWLEPGAGNEGTFLNRARVDRRVGLKAHDTIEVGCTFLRFIPFCGDFFQWR